MTSVSYSTTRPRKNGARAKRLRCRIELSGSCGGDDRAVGTAQRRRRSRPAAHQHALEERLTAEVSRAMDQVYGCGARGQARTAVGRDQSRAERSRRFWKRSTWPAVSTIVCLPVKNGWQLEQMSTRSTARVEPTANSCGTSRRRPARGIGMDVGLHADVSCRLRRRRRSASMRMRFLSRRSCSNLTRPVDRSRTRCSRGRDRCPGRRGRSCRAGGR